MELRLMLNFILSISLFIGLSSCDPVSTTNFVIDNSLDQELEIYMNFSNQIFLQEDTTIRMSAGQEFRHFTIEKTGKEAFFELSDFLADYDSIVAVQEGNIVSKNFIDDIEWNYNLLEEDLAEYRLIIDENDF